MGIDFGFTKPGKRRHSDSGLVQKPYETKLPWQDFRMGYTAYLMMRFRLYSLFNARFGLVWMVWAFSESAMGGHPKPYKEDAAMMAEIEKHVPRALIPVVTQGDTDGAMSSKEVQRLSFELQSPDFDPAGEIPPYRIAVPKYVIPWEPLKEVNTCANWPDDAGDAFDVNCERSKEAVAQYARVVCEAARLGFGLQW